MEFRFLSFISLIGFSFSATHWIVTEDGRIQTPADSLFHMVQSHDLVQFMRQEERVRNAEAAQKDIDGQKSVINSQEGQDDPKIEEKLMESDLDCVKAGKPLAQQNLFSTFAISLESLGFESSVYIGEPRKTKGKEKPNCEKSMKLVFSMSAFEHLQAMQSRRNLSMAPERALGAAVHPAWPNTSDYGHAISLALRQNPTSWVLHNLATFYWRIVGGASNAVECARRALHLSPRTALTMSLLNLASVFHHSGASRDAAVVLDVLLSLNDSAGTTQCAAGDVYAVTVQYNKSVAAYERCSKLLPGSYPEAERHRAAVRCHQKLESALENQHQNLQRTLNELQSYQARLRKYQTTHEAMIHNVADPETKHQMSLTYDYVTYGAIDHLKCGLENDNGVRFLHCSVSDWEAFKATRAKKQRELEERRSAGKPQKSKVKSAESRWQATPP